VTYDALGRAVETSYNSAYTEVWYTQLGKVYMTGGTTPYYAYWPTPGNGTAEVNGNAITFYYMHKDWLRNSRISSVIVNPIVVADQAYAPYGEVYNSLATGAGVPAQMFTGDTQDIIGGIFDTPNRELNSSQGRWLSPDPANSGWNQYAYVTNPNSYIDPSGLACYPLERAMTGSCAPFMNNGVNFGANWNFLDLIMGITICKNGDCGRWIPTGALNYIVDGASSLSRWYTRARFSVGPFDPCPVGNSNPQCKGIPPIKGLSVSEIAGPALLLVGAAGSTASVAGSASEIFSGAQSLAGYNIAAAWGMVGDTYSMNISLLVATEDAEGLGALTDAIVSQAQAAGASNISVTGSMVTEEGFFNSALAARYGWTYEQVDSSKFMLTMPLPPVN
jgi:RHS repeat-associated protein